MVTAVSVSTKATSRGAPKMVIRDNTGHTFTAPYAPKVVKVDQEGLLWEESKRPGRRAVLRVGEVKAKRITMTFTFWDRNHNSVVPQMGALTHIANRDVHCTIAYSPIETGLWRITDLSYDVIDRNENNEPFRAEITVTFQQVDIDSVIPGPIVAKVSPPPAPAPAPSGGRTYTVKRGDTLWEISIVYYGSGLHWRRIADANGVRDPRKLQIGHVLRIP